MGREQKKCSLLVGSGKERRLALPASIYDHYRHICGLCQYGNFLFYKSFLCKGLVPSSRPLGVLNQAWFYFVPCCTRGHFFLFVWCLCRSLGKGIPSGVCTEAGKAGHSLVYICCKCKFVVARVVGRGF
jgi:hypothetical protein